MRGGKRVVGFAEKIGRRREMGRRVRMGGAGRERLVRDEEGKDETHERWQSSET